MKLLVVEGNTKETRLERGNFGIKPYNEMFAEMLQFLKPKAEVDVAFPTDTEKKLPSVNQLRSYDGVLITGSSLSVLDNISEVSNQLNFIDTVFKSGTPIYGSCWGLQLATVVAGGTVTKGGNGLELGVSKPIHLTEAGRNSTFFKDRKEPFEALCIHYDEVHVVPKETTLLATNSHSKVQAMVFNYKKSSFFGVQYHPEFTPKVMARIIAFLKNDLIRMKHYANNDLAEDRINRLENNKVVAEILDYKRHTQEIGAWLKNL